MESSDAISPDTADAEQLNNIQIFMKYNETLHHSQNNRVFMNLLANPVN